jgi:hypothetical protein
LIGLGVTAVWRDLMETDFLLFYAHHLFISNPREVLEHIDASRVALAERRGRLRPERPAGVG